MFPLEHVVQPTNSAEVQSPLIWLRYTLLLLIFPAYFIALSRHRWTTIPLWLVSASVMAVQCELNARQSTLLIGGFAPSAFLWVAEAAKIMAIPIAVQFAVMLKAWQSRVGNRAGNAPRTLIEIFNAGEL
jgi:hypothetical protein